MKTLLKVVSGVFGILVLLIICLIAFLTYAAKQPAVKNNYYENVITELPLEQKYTQKGEFTIYSNVYESENEKIRQFKVWYPTEIENADSKVKYPLVVMVNGSGVRASKYEPIFEHLASWGFIVVGNEDESSFDGSSSSASLDLMLDLNRDSTSISTFPKSKISKYNYSSSSDVDELFTLNPWTYLLPAPVP